MKKVVVTGPRQAAVVDVPDPQPIANWVVVQIHTAPMCTEYKAYRAGGPVEQLGHEAAGEVVAVAQPGRVQVGDRVVVMPTNACGQCTLCLAGDYIHCENNLNFAAIHGTRDGSATYAQYLLKPDHLLVPISNGLSYDHAAMACCGLGPTFGAMQTMAVNAFDTVLITGLGPVGLGGVINGVFRGARVIGVETNPYRAALAKELGAAAIVDPTDPDALAQIRELTAGRGVDKAIDCSGVVAAHRLCIDAARRKGQVAFVGECSEETPLRISPDMIRKGLTLIGSWHYRMQDTPAIMGLIGKVGAQLDKLITHRFPLAAVQEAWELQLTGESAKVLLQPWA
ncbi:MAG TPA: zinc-binding dehydrogenase [Caldilineaceae bacterium]|nr:zinc-binding dehydrogenase [Caldilineaceae bacterium]